METKDLKQQTAVEWYAEKSVILTDNLLNNRITFKEWFTEQANIQGQAKEMEKQQMIDNYINGMYKGQELYFGEHKIKLDVNSLPYSCEIAEQYYNETFKNA